MFLAELLYIIIWGFGVFFFIRIIQKPQLIYHYPYIMSFGFVVFIVPQAYAIYENNIFDTGPLIRLFLMTLLCWGMSFFGWYVYRGKNLIFKNLFLRPINEANLGLIAIVFVCAGIIVNFIASRLIVTSNFENQQATGVVTIYIFFQQLLFLGTGLCLVLGLQRTKPMLMLFAVIGILYGIYIGVFQGKRTETLYIAFVVGTPLYLKFGIRPPRVLIAASILIIFFIVPSMDQYRRILKKSEGIAELYKGLSQIDFKKNIDNFYSDTKTIELANAGYTIEYAYSTGEYKIGFDYWNRIVFRFVPAQIVGKKFKESLMLQKSPFAKINPAKKVRRKYILGTTSTGMADSFLQFDYLGCLFFFFLGILMKKLWHTLNATGNPFIISLYSILLVDCIISLTHGTVFFLPNFFSAFIFLIIAAKLSKI